MKLNPQGILIHFDEHVAVAEPPAATPAAPERPASETVTQPSLKERVSALKGKANEHWRMHGDLEAAEALMGTTTKSDVTVESSPSREPEPPSDEEGAGTTEPASGPGKKEQSTKSPRTSWSELREAKAKAEARAELLEKQLAELRKSPPDKKDEPKPAAEAKPAVDPNKPKRPRLSDFDDVEKYEAAMDKYEEAKEKWDSQTFEQREAARTQKQQFQQASEKWEQQKDAGRKKYGKDFDAVAFDPKTPASLVQIVEVQAREDAADVMYYLGKHPDVSAKLAETTDIPVSYGKFDTWAQLNAAMSKNPGLAYLVGEKRGLAKAEIQRIADSLKKTAPLPKDTVRTPKPSGEVAVEANATPASDDDAALLKRAAQGDKTAARVWKERQNKRELQELGHI